MNLHVNIFSHLSFASGFSGNINCFSVTLWNGGVGRGLTAPFGKKDHKTQKEYATVLMRNKGIKEKKNLPFLSEQNKLYYCDGILWWYRFNEVDKYAALSFHLGQDISDAI